VILDVPVFLSDEDVAAHGSRQALLEELKFLALEQARKHLAAPAPAGEWEQPYATSWPQGGGRQYVVRLEWQQGPI